MEWKGRSYKAADYEASDVLNQALSAATACLYGLVHAVVVSLGCSPGLGFVHVGHDRSFVFDVADLYKVELAVPVAFRIAATDSSDIGGDVRRAMRDAMHAAHLLERCAGDVGRLLLGESVEEAVVEADVVSLWDGERRLAAGQNFAPDWDEDVPW